MAAILVQTLQQRRKLIEEFQASDVLFFDRVLLFRSHEDDYARWNRRAQG